MRKRALVRVKKRALVAGSMMVVLAASMVLVPGIAVASEDGWAHRSRNTYVTDGWAHRSGMRVSEQGPVSTTVAESLVPQSDGTQVASTTVAETLVPQSDFAKVATINAAEVDVPSLDSPQPGAIAAFEKKVELADISPKLAGVTATQGWERTAGLPPSEFTPQIVAETSSGIGDEILLAALMLGAGLGLGIGGGVMFVRRRTPRPAH